MEKELSDKDLRQIYTPTSDEINLVKRKPKKTRVYFLALYKFYQCYKKFPEDSANISKQILKYIAKQISVRNFSINLSDRTKRHLLSEIRNIFDIKTLTPKNTDNLKNWLISEILPVDHKSDFLKENILKYLTLNGIESISELQIKKLIKSSLSTFEQKAFREIFSKLDHDFSASVNNWINNHDQLPEGLVTLSEIKKNPGAIGINSVFVELNKLKTINSLNLPDNIFNNLSEKVIHKYYQRATAQGIWEFSRQPEQIRNFLLAIFLFIRKRIIIDNLAELLIQIIHKIKINSVKKVERELILEIKQTYGKEKILLDIAESSVSNPQGIVENIVYPAAGGEGRLKNLILEIRSKKEYNQRVYSVIRKSYNSHYRRIIPDILDIIQFKSNNDAHQPLIKAINLIKKYATSKATYFSEEELDIIINGVVDNQLINIVLENDQKSGQIINRINYEICVLQSLRDKLRCKEIWIVGAKKYGNPDDDLPKDFNQKRVEYYSDLNLPILPEEFINQFQKQLQEALINLNTNIPKNNKVKILQKQNGWISLSPLDPQPLPPNLQIIKRELFKKWEVVSLLDVIKETFLTIPLIKHFKSVATREVLSPDILQKRIIMAIYGVGTNAGLKRVIAGNSEENYKNLNHIFQNYLTKDNLRFAIAEIVNQLFKIRDPKIWGDSTTSCASDSKKFGAWDQNLMTEWHNRYQGRGIMIYWHVEKNSVCINSQLKRCSSSEVSAMIEGVLHHCTEMEVEKNYVDTHGQSVVAFAFSYLLGFELLPRLKSIYSQKLYLPETALREKLHNLTPIIAKRTIDWQLIKQQYDEMVKYAIALKLRTAEAESIIKRFTRNNLKHPTYIALCELGKAVKTIFIYNYLMFEELRREIHEGLNVVESWNAVNNFILFGKGGEFASNNFENQEITALCLHFIQNSLVYVNTLMFQEILKKNQLMSLMTKADFRAITPLIYEHITPYGSFNLDMNKRIL